MIHTKEKKSVLNPTLFKEVHILSRHYFPQHMHDSTWAVCDTPELDMEKKSRIWNVNKGTLLTWIKIT